MCLQELIFRKQIPEKIYRVYKEGFINKKHFTTFPMCAKISYGKWIHDTRLNVITAGMAAGGPFIYESGFHAFMEEPSLVLFGKLYRCFVREVVAIGVEGISTVLVAKQIYIPKPHTWFFQRDFWIRWFGPRFLPKE